MELLARGLTPSGGSPEFVGKRRGLCGMSWSPGKASGLPGGVTTPDVSLETVNEATDVEPGLVVVDSSGQVKSLSRESVVC